MRLGRLTVLISVAYALTLTGVAATRTHRVPSSHKTAKHVAKPKFQSQRSMDDQRATEIQGALIKAGYLAGTPSGHWDAASEVAMQKVQADNGWQTKLVPDSRALIKLGLGPAPASSASVASSAGSVGEGKQ